MRYTSSDKSDGCLSDRVPNCPDAQSLAPVSVLRAFAQQRFAPALGDVVEERGEIPFLAKDGNRNVFFYRERYVSNSPACR